MGWRGRVLIAFVKSTQLWGQGNNNQQQGTHELTLGDEEGAADVGAVIHSDANGQHEADGSDAVEGEADPVHEACR